MNRFFVIIIFFISIFITMATSLYTSKKSAANIHEQLASNLKDTTKNYLESLTSASRNNILQGNIREVRTNLEEMIDNKLILGYKIVNNQNIVSSNTDLVSTSNNHIDITIDIFFSADGEKWGSIKYYISTKDINKISNNAEVLFISTFMTSTFIIIALILSLFIFLFHSDVKLGFLIENYFKFNFTITEPLYLKLVWKPLINRIKSSAEESFQMKLKLIETENIKMLNKVSRQVSHDIRSPLAALSVALEDISTLPEKNRVILKLAIQRIQDIANNLLKNSNKDDSTLSATLISTVIDEILSEKRVQYKALSTISIERSFEDELNLFAIINHSQLKQIISNLINNSVEAIDKKNGKVEVKIYKDKNQAIIEVLDNGKGIPVEILNQLGKGNISFGKDDLEFAGFGIGVKHAFDTIQSWGGNISISSYEGIGTSFKINLPLAPAPSWFINKLEFSCGQVILVLDDDHEIHQVWEKKLEDLSLTRHHFYNSKLLLDWIHNNPNTDFILLSDYELIGDISTGLDLIKKLDIQDRSILVTSHYEDVIKQDSTIKVIPKNIVSSIHICVDEKVLF